MLKFIPFQDKIAILFLLQNEALRKDRVKFINKNFQEDWEKFSPQDGFSPTHKYFYFYKSKRIFYYRYT